MKNKFKWKENNIDIYKATKLNPRIQKTVILYDKRLEGKYEMPCIIYQADWLEKNKTIQKQKQILKFVPIKNEL